MNTQITHTHTHTHTRRHAPSGVGASPVCLTHRSVHTLPTPSLSHKHFLRTNRRVALTQAALRTTSMRHTQRVHTAEALVLSLRVRLTANAYQHCVVGDQEPVLRYRRARVRGKAFPLHAAFVYVCVCVYVCCACIS
jgi:hypothetical protein